ncbi:Pentatricopeptide repeat-containing protein [Acorus calamus]|uniref:Pentatricopeptide repeat-containing protein n=1 Tax=Acorus calamus TaxID=4465 RepID=A0AAV9D510_ACOCL|nr:Pentatricopeptide repeat-containing protein [Acorus calamus]
MGEGNPHISHRENLPLKDEIHYTHVRWQKDSQAHHLLLSKLLSFPTTPTSYALSILLSIPSHSTPLFNRFITRFSRSRDANHEAAVLAYAKMRRDGVPIDRFSLPPLLRSTARIEGGGVVGREVHGLAVKMGFGSDPFVQTGLVGFYGARGRVGDARLVFDRMSNRDLIAWGVMLDGYYQSGHYKEVLSLYQEMKKGPSPDPDQVIFVTILSACARTRDLKSGEQIHASISRRNLATDGHLDTALINMYASCASMDTARRLYDRMPPPKNPIASTAMVSGYSKSGSISAARSIFDQTVDRDLVSWSAMISAYAESDRPDEALKLFSQMRASGVQPDRVTVLSVVSACARIGALERARWIDDFARARGFRGTWWWTMRSSTCMRSAGAWRTRCGCSRGWGGGGT